MSLGPTVTSPTYNSTLTNSSATFEWTANNEPVTAWWLFIGSSVGADDVYKKYLPSSTSVSVNLLPTDGRTLYVRLWYQIAGVWQFTDGQYTSATLSAPAMTSSYVFGSTLGSTGVTFNWTANGDSIDAWWLFVGSSVGATDVYSKYVPGASTSTSVSSLPMDGRTLFVRLWYQRGGVWQFVDGQYTAATLSAPAMTVPALGSTLGNSNVTFNWTANGDSY